MSLPILTLLRSASPQQLCVARSWTADNLHLPEEQVTDEVAVAYVHRHYKAGQLEGWDGFIKDVEG